ncbi:hypothetical protein [Enterococcus sp. DIV1420a]|uniref:hypothetical protein n=1 Tax=Enterococcus sp. DIV1420a TaxID=2774672 RepID=UPI003F683E8E
MPWTEFLDRRDDIPDYYNKKYYLSLIRLEAKKRIEKGIYWYIALNEVHIDSARIKGIQRLTNEIIVDLELASR